MPCFSVFIVKDTCNTCTGKTPAWCLCDFQETRSTGSLHHVPVHSSTRRYYYTYIAIDLRSYAATMCVVVEVYRYLGIS